MLSKSDTREEAFDATMFQTWSWQAPVPFPKFIDTSYAVDEIPQYDSFEPAPDDFYTALSV
jgi:hypothetical protein